MKTKEHRTVLASAGQIKELISAVVESVPVNLEAERVQYLIGHKSELAKGIKNVLLDGKGSGDKHLSFLSDWQTFYRSVFGLELNFSGLRVPERQEGFDRLIVVVQGMTPQKLYDKCAELFPCWKWTNRNLDEIVISDRTANNGPYAVRFRDRVEADEEFKNLSADQLKQMNVSGITLEEHLLFELKFFKETGQHLDIHNWTLCAGSRYAGGDAPRVVWGGGRLRVGWCNPGVARVLLRSRQAVS